MTPDEWADRDPEILPANWGDTAASDASCRRCGADVALDTARLCERCHGLVTAAVSRGGHARDGSLPR